jgi:hypothetical protein
MVAEMDQVLVVLVAVEVALTVAESPLVLAALEEDVVVAPEFAVM